MFLQKQFLEFAPDSNRNIQHGKPYGYYHRLKAFESTWYYQNCIQNLKKVLL